MSSSTGRSNSSRPANGIDASASTPRAASTRMSRAEAAACASSALLPMPGSPLITSDPARADARVGEQTLDRGALRIAPEQHARVCPRECCRAVQVGALM